MDSSNHGTEHMLRVDLKTNLQNQEHWDLFFPKLIENKRKITKLTWVNTVLIEAQKNNIELKIGRNDETDELYLLSEESVISEQLHDPYAISGCTTCSS